MDNKVNDRPTVSSSAAVDWAAAFNRLNFALVFRQSLPGPSPKLSERVDLLNRPGAAEDR